VLTPGDGEDGDHVAWRRQLEDCGRRRFYERRTGGVSNLFYVDVSVSSNWVEGFPLDYTERESFCSIAIEVFIG